MAMNDGKVRNLIEYLDNMESKGKASHSAMNPLRIAIRKITKIIDGDKWEDTDVKSIDIIDYMDRFAVLTSGTYSPESLIAYKSRLTRAIGWYLKFLQTPGWTPEIGKRIANSKTKVLSNKVHPSNSTKTTISVTSPDPVPQSASSIANTSDRILFPYPLSDGQIVHISLPIKLSRLDAKRIASFVESIAVDDIAVKKEVA